MDHMWLSNRGTPGSDPSTGDTVDFWEVFAIELDTIIAGAVNLRGNIRRTCDHLTGVVPEAGNFAATAHSIRQKAQSIEDWYAFQESLFTGIHGVGVD